MLTGPYVPAAAAGDMRTPPARTGIRRQNRAVSPTRRTPVQCTEEEPLKKPLGQSRADKPTSKLETESGASRE